MDNCGTLDDVHDVAIAQGGRIYFLTSSSFYITNQVEFVVASCNTLSGTFKESQSCGLSSCSNAMTYKYNKACTARAADVLQKIMKFTRNVSAGDER